MLFDYFTKIASVYLRVYNLGNILA